MGMVLFTILDESTILKVNIWHEHVRKIAMKLTFFGHVINFWKTRRPRLNTLDPNDNGKCDKLMVKKSVQLLNNDGFVVYVRRTKNVENKQVKQKYMYI